MLDKNKIQLSLWAAGSPILLGSKNNGKGFYLYIDCRQLNKITIKDKKPILLIDKLLVAVARAI
jgi:hypothetical protein